MPRALENARDLLHRVTEHETTFLRGRIESMSTSFRAVVAALEVVLQVSDLYFHGIADQLMRVV